MCPKQIEAVRGHEFDFHYRLKTGAPFSGERFNGLRIENLFAAEADLTGIELHNSVFCGCDFSGVVFDEGSLNGCVFSECDLTKATFHSTEAEGLSFLECLLDGASFNFADLDETVFHECSGAVKMVEASNAGSTFTGCGFENSDFRATDLSKAAFYEGSIARSLISGKTWLDGTVFQGTDITDTCLTMATYHNKADFSGAIIFPFAPAPQAAAPPTHLVKQPIAPLSRQLLGPKQSSHLAIYRGVDLTARLYCADIEEFRRTR